MRKQVLTEKLANGGAGANARVRGPYASPLMADRKRRILDEAQALLDESGVEGFTVRELSRRAEVAQRTLYNVFGSKEDIIIAIIELQYEPLKLSMAPLEMTIESIIERQKAVTKWVMQRRRYAGAMASAYFALKSDPRIHEFLERLWRVGSGAWLYDDRVEQLLVPIAASQRDALAALLVNSGYANVGDWAAGRISDAEFQRRALSNPLLICRNWFRPLMRTRLDKIMAGAPPPGRVPRRRSSDRRASSA